MNINEGPTEYRGPPTPRRSSLTSRDFAYAVEKCSPDEMRTTAEFLDVLGRCVIMLRSAQCLIRCAFARGVFPVKYRASPRNHPIRTEVPAA